MVLSIINSVSVAIVFPKHNRVQEPHTASAPTVAWRPAVAFLRGEGRSAGFSKTLNQYAYQNQHLVCTHHSWSLRLRLSTMSAPPVFTALRPERTLSAPPKPLVPLPTLMVTMPPPGDTGSHFRALRYDAIDNGFN